MNNTFSKYHPLVNFIYFIFVLAFSMFFAHPVSLVISVLCGFIYSVRLNGIRALKFNFTYVLPIMLVAAIMNPLFNHGGITVIGYLPTGNPFTLESVAFGLYAAGMMAAVIMWFSCYNTVMTSDKFIYLFGKVIPSLSLVLSMALRFVPKFKQQLHMVMNAQKCIGRDLSCKSKLKRCKNAVGIMSVMTTWALENAIETADSMKSRGYGLEGRSAFSIYVFTTRDIIALCVICTLGICVLIGNLFGCAYFRYFPSIGGEPLSIGTISVFVAYLLLCAFPFITEIRGDK